MEAARTSESDDNFYTKDGKIRVTPEEWAAAYAQILAEPHGWYNKSIAPVLGEVLRRTEGVTRLQIAEALADKKIAIKNTIITKACPVTAGATIPSRRVRGR